MDAPLTPPTTHSLLTPPSHLNQPYPSTPPGPGTQSEQARQIQQVIDAWALAHAIPDTRYGIIDNNSDDGLGDGDHPSHRGRGLGPNRWVRT